MALGMCTLTCLGGSKVCWGLPPALWCRGAQEVRAEQLQDAGLPCQRGWLGAVKKQKQNKLLKVFSAGVE